MAIEIRAATLDDAAGIAMVAVDTWRIAYRGIVPDEVLAGLSYERRAAQALQQIQAAGSQQFTLVAADEDGQVVGFASGGRERSGEHGFRGELYAIYVLAAFQGRGVGRRLAGRVAAELLARGFNSMLLWVLADNQPSRRFYEALGGVPVAEQTIELGVALPEVAYGWRDLAPLAAEPAC
ncbi:MAG TPA: GNAT family N-acetyltransferase [Herpetosiphonaceae bacterium]